MPRTFRAMGCPILPPYSIRRTLNASRFPPIVRKVKPSRPDYDHAHEDHAPILYMFLGLSASAIYQSITKTSLKKEATELRTILENQQAGRAIFNPQSGLVEDVVPSEKWWFRWYWNYPRTTGKYVPPNSDLFCSAYERVLLKTLRIRL
jgi:hypothetical protein